MAYIGNTELKLKRSQNNREKNTTIDFIQVSIKYLCGPREREGELKSTVHSQHPSGVAVGLALCSRDHLAVRLTSPGEASVPERGSALPFENSSDTGTRSPPVPVTVHCPGPRGLMRSMC